MIASTALVLMMTLRGSRCFTAAWSGRRTFSRRWRRASSRPRSCRSVGLLGYSLTFSGDGAYLGDFARIGLMGLG